MTRLPGLWDFAREFAWQNYKNTERLSILHFISISLTRLGVVGMDTNKQLLNVIVYLHVHCYTIPLFLI